MGASYLEIAGISVAIVGLIATAAYFLGQNVGELQEIKSQQNNQFQRLTEMEDKASERIGKLR